MSARPRAHRTLLAAAGAAGLVATLAAAPAAASRFPLGGPDRDGREATKKDEGEASPLSERQPLARRRPSSPPLAIVGADVYPVTSEPIEGGVLLLRDGRIEAILRPRPGRASARDRVPEAYEVIEADGLRAYPGLVAAGADGLGLARDAWVGAGEDPLARSPVESFDPWSMSVEWALSAGITSGHVFLRPSTEKPLVGRGDAIKMSFGEPEGLLLEEAVGIWAARDVLDPRRRHALRRMIEEAREWAEKPPGKRKANETHRRVLDLAERRVPLWASAAHAGELAGLLDLADELDLELVVYHSPEAWTLAERLAEANVSCVQDVRTNWFKPRDTRRRSLPGGWRHDAVVRLARAGVPVAVVPQMDAILTWGVAGRDLTNLPLEAAFAQRAGLTPQEALESITIGAARLLGVDERVGSLEVGKDADVILVDGDVLDYRSFVRKAVVNGRVVYDAATNRFWRRVIEARDRAEEQEPLPERIDEGIELERSRPGPDGGPAATASRGGPP